MREFGKICIVPSKSGWQANFEAVKVTISLSMTAIRMMETRCLVYLSIYPLFAYAA